MRAPFQVLVLPYRQRDDGTYEFAVFRRGDVDFWQGIAGGGEDDETPLDAARREAFEEGGIPVQSRYVALDTMTSVPRDVFSGTQLWPPDLYVVPEHAFGVDCGGHELRLSSEHTDARWLLLPEAQRIVKFDSNRVALGELHQRLMRLDPERSAVSHPEPPDSYRRLGERIAELRMQGVCPTCHDLATGELFGDQHVLFEDTQFRIALEQHPRATGHTIIVYKQHRDDFTQLGPDETAALFTLATRVANALKHAAGAEKVYLVTMCDGAPNHLHLELLPRLPGEPIGSRRFVTPRAVLENGDRMAASIRAALDQAIP